MRVAFFVLGQFRSGTTWVTELLKASGFTVYQEAKYALQELRPADTRTGIQVFSKGLDPTEYLRSRKKRMEEMLPADAVIGEVQAYLRYCAPQMREVFGAKIVGLIRDGRFVVRSFLTTAHEDWVPRFKPIGEISVQWGEMSQLEKVSWLWADTYRRLMDDGIEIFRIEDLSHSYREVQRLCKILQIEVKRQVWQTFSGRYVHVHVGEKETPDCNLGWSPDQIASFMRFAGDIQSKFGYSEGLPNGNRVYS